MYIFLNKIELNNILKFIFLSFYSENCLLYESCLEIIEVIFIFFLLINKY